jgi:NADH dehydrogenase
MAPEGSAVLVAGGTGRLGQLVVARLVCRGRSVRVLTRGTARTRAMVKAFPDQVEVVTGDVRDRASLQPALVGISAVVSAIHGFAGAGLSPATVDWAGNHNLLEAARAAGATDFVLLSVHQAAASHPIELFRMKYRAEQAVRASGLRWTILRATAFMETWLNILAAPLVKGQPALVFGRGTNPINFVSAYDVAEYVAEIVDAPALRGEIFEAGGRENISMNTLVDVFRQVTGCTGPTRRIPRPALRLMAALMRPFKPELARQAQAAMVMDTKDMTFKPGDGKEYFPASSPHTLADVVARDFGQQP